MSTIRQAVILCGGKGTRLAGYEHRPKALVRVDGEPVLRSQIRRLKYAGIRDILLLTGHRHDEIVAAIRGWRLNLSWSACRDEEDDCGTGFALLRQTELLDDSFLLIYGDIYAATIFGRILRFHENVRADITAVVHPTLHMTDSDIVHTRGAQITGISRINTYVDQVYANLTLAGIYVLRQSAVARCSVSPGESLENDILRPNLLLSSGGVFAYHTADYIRDIGTPERLNQTRDDVLCGYDRPYARPTVFLDRDGVLTREGYINTPDEFELLPGAASACRKLREAGYRLACITNQGGISLGYLTERRLAEIHAKMDWELAREGAYLDITCHCPHYPAVDGPCDCRKPATGLLRRAARYLQSCCHNSWMIGDRSSDIQAGHLFGLRTILVGDKHPGDSFPTYRVADLSEAADIICEEN